MRCLDINPKKPPKGKWFCCDARKKLSASKREKTASPKSELQNDYVYNYSIGIVWQGLNLLCRRDAVREADDEAMLSFWKFDLVHFLRINTQNMLFSLIASLLLSMYGCLPS